MDDESNAVERMIAAVKRLALLPEAEIQRVFESISDDEIEATTALMDDAVGRADRVLGVKPEEPPQNPE